MDYNISYYGIGFLAQRAWLRGLYAIPGLIAQMKQGASRNFNLGPTYQSNPIIVFNTVAPDNGEALAKVAVRRARCCWRSASSSPSSMASPPSPDSATTCRPGWLACAPITCGSALAMLP